MTFTTLTATVFGGTGFIGTQIVRELAARGYRIKVATRVPERAYDLRPCGTVGQVVPIECDYNDDASVIMAVAGSDIVVNCIGILFEKGKRQTFSAIHADLPQRLATASTQANVKKFVHISGLGIDQASSKYAQSKLDGEVAVLNHFSGATILRPSIVFGENDSFFNLFARMIMALPSFIPLPLIGGGKTKFQPVFVGDVADAVMAAIDSPEAQGKIYELGGPDVVSFKEIYEILFHYTKRRQALVPVPFFMAKIQAFFMEVLPKPLLTRDQVESLKTDNILSGDHPALKDLGVTPTAIDLVVPQYLARYRPGGRFADIPQHES